jgi:hypothetical protein
MDGAVKFNLIFVSSDSQDVTIFLSILQVIPTSNVLE